MRLPATLFRIVLVSMLGVGSARAQGVELGVGLALTCRPLEYAFCDEVWGHPRAVHASWWASRSLVLELRGLRLDGPSTRTVPVTELVEPHRYHSRAYSLRDERRTALQASLLYHFRPGRTLRPFIGGGAGRVWWRGEAFCDARQIECDRVLPPQAPALDGRDWVLSFAGGLAVDAGRGVVIRSGLRDTMVPASLRSRGDSAVLERARRSDLPEYFVSVGYRW